METKDTLRHHPDLQDLVQECQARHADDAELAKYLEVAPENAGKVEAAKAIREIEGKVVRNVIKRIFDVYPYEQNHELAVTKATRDVRMVVTYATLCMLLNDQAWYQNKLLFWMKRILQAFRFPDKAAGKSYIFASDSEGRGVLEKLKPHQRSIYETMKLLDVEMKNELPSDAYAEIEPFLALAVDILSND